MFASSIYTEIFCAFTLHRTISVGVSSRWYHKCFFFSLLQNNLKHSKALIALVGIFIVRCSKDQSRVYVSDTFLGNVYKFSNFIKTCEFFRLLVGPTEKASHFTLLFDLCMVSCLGLTKEYNNPPNTVLLKT